MNFMNMEQIHKEIDATRGLRWAGKHIWTDCHKCWRDRPCLLLWVRKRSPTDIYSPRMDTMPVEGIEPDYWCYPCFRYTNVGLDPFYDRMGAAWLRQDILLDEVIQFLTESIEESLERDLPDWARMGGYCMNKDGITYFDCHVWKETGLWCVGVGHKLEICNNCGQARCVAGSECWKKATPHNAVVSS